MLSDREFYKNSYSIFLHYILKQNVQDKSVFDKPFWDKATEKMLFASDKGCLKIMKLTCLPKKEIKYEDLLNLLFTVTCRSISTFNQLCNKPDEWGSKLIWPYDMDSLIIVSDWADNEEFSYLKLKLTPLLLINEWNSLDFDNLRLIYPKTFKKFNKYYLK